MKHINENYPIDKFEQMKSKLYLLINFIQIVLII